MRKSPIALSVAAGLLAFGLTAAQASAVTTAYVSPSGTSAGSDTSCRTAGYSNINTAIAATGAGGTVVVCRGAYDTQAVVSKPLDLIGRPGAIVNAKGQPPLTIGKMKLPGSVGIGVLGTSDVRVSGFKVENAGFDAIAVGMSSHVVVSGNILVDNGGVGVGFFGLFWCGGVLVVFGGLLGGG